MAAFTHVIVGTNDLPRARAFYDEVLGKLGLSRIADLSETGSIWGADAPSFFVLKPANGQPATVGNGSCPFTCAERINVMIAAARFFRLAGIVRTTSPTSPEATAVSDFRFGHAGSPIVPRHACA